MTAVTMIFEMTRDYDIVLPMILAVAVGARRAPVIVARKHLHPEAGPARPPDPQSAARKHVSGAPRQGGDGAGLSERARRIPASAHFSGGPTTTGRMRHVVVTRDDRIVGVVRINTGLAARHRRYRDRASPSAMSRPRNFTLVRDDDVAFDVITRMWRRNAVMAHRGRAHRRKAPFPPAAAKRRGRGDHQGACRRCGGRQHPGLSAVTGRSGVAASLQPRLSGRPRRCAAHWWRRECRTEPRR